MKLSYLSFINYIKDVGIQKLVAILVNIYFCSYFIYFTIFACSKYDISLIISGLVILIIFTLLLLIFGRTKNTRTYTFTFSLLLTIGICAGLVLGGYHGSTFLEVIISIICIMCITDIPTGSFFVSIIIIAELIVFKYHNVVPWITEYHPELSNLFNRFLAVQLTTYVLTSTAHLLVTSLYTKLLKEKETKKQLFINIVHDIKTPLTIIHNYIDQITDNKIDPSSVKLLKSNIFKLEKDIINILDTDKIEKGSFIPNDKNIISNISSITTDIYNIFKPYALSKNINLTGIIEDNIHSRIDQSSYTQILNNLLENAIKFTHSGGEINLLLTCNSCTAYLSVKDTGIGISDSDQNKIFNSYYQGYKGTESSYGLGLGLCLAKELCEGFNGKISVSSRVEEGSSFLVSLPTCSGKGATKPKTTSSHYCSLTPPPSLNKYNEDLRTLLIIEDNNDIRNLLINSLNNEYNILVSSDGSNALNICNCKSNIDLIISDILMPNMDGYEFINKLKENNDNELLIPVIFISAMSRDEEIIKCLNLGAVDFISKPFSVVELKAKIESILMINNNKQNKIFNNFRNNLQDYLIDLDNSKSSKKGDMVIDYAKLRQFSITKKEEQIISEIFKGYSHKKIGENLNISTSTVNTHIHRIYKKCDVNNYVNLIKLFS